MGARTELSASHAIAEWGPCRALWVAWPHDRSFWGEFLDTAKREILELCEIVDDAGTTALEVLVHNREAQLDFEHAAANLSAHVNRVQYDDIWMRDIGPVFAKGPQGLTAACFSFNGWGGKWAHGRDQRVAGRVAEVTDAVVVDVPVVLEGGAVEFDGEGTCLTTKAVALNANRNPGATTQDVFDALESALGVRKMLWIDEGLIGDHTDGHIDNIARFVAPGRIACSVASDASDPNAALYEQIRNRLNGQTDAAGRSLELVEVPSPGRIEDAAGVVLPASYLNFCVTDSVVVVPVFGSPYDVDGVEAIRACFPSRETVGISAHGLLNGGGAFHCMTLNEPRVGPKPTEN